MPIYIAIFCVLPLLAGLGSGVSGVPLHQEKVVEAAAAAGGGGHCGAGGGGPAAGVGV